MAMRGDFLDELSTKCSGLSSLQRVLIMSDGTVTTALTAAFGKPVTVKVIGQVIVNDVIIRTVHLMIGELIACTAVSMIPVSGNTGYIVNEIKEGKRGIGEILKGIGIGTVRRIYEIESNDKTFTRMYHIYSKEDAVSIFITETFSIEVIDMADEMYGKCALDDKL